MMIESNIRKLSRMELLYTCISRLAILINKSDKELLPEQLRHYVDPNDFNEVIYHQRSTDTDDRMQTILNDADLLLSLCGSGYEDTTEYGLFIRCLSEQTVVENKKRRLCTKEDGTMNSTALQNPSDPEAAFWTKAGKNHRGYVANLEESVGKSGTVVTDYAYEQNIYSDSQFLKEHLEQMGTQEETVTVVTDGAYSGVENTALAKEKNVNLITTSLTGREAPDIITDFEFNEEGTKVIRCPAGQEPKSCTYMAPGKQCQVSFQRDQCAGCPYQNQCHPEILKRVAKIVTSRAAHDKAVIQRTMHGEEFKNYARLRNDVETVPSVIQNHYHLDKMPRGKQRGKFFFGCKIMAFNFRKLFNFRKGLGHYAPNPVIA